MIIKKEIIREDDEIVKDIDNVSNNTKSEKKNISAKNKTDKTDNDDNTFKYFIYGLVAALAIIVILSFVHFNTDANILEYNQFKFYQDESGNWLTKVQMSGQIYNIPFNHYPADVEDMTIDSLIQKRILTLNSSDTLFIAVDEETPSVAVVAGTQISRLYKYGFIKVPVHGAIFDSALDVDEYMKTESNSNQPLRINQLMATNNQVIMRFKSSEVSAMYFADDSYNLINVDAKDPEDFRRLCDKLAYELLGIIQD